ncbi:uncharacterized protein K452DRAFT_248174 [Aplosporella prunicola CBS 121167]|uniref:Mitochondrial import inner membrane translocase subunit n=1 Tax=Aplosporella prunicola CBS 121167 TaxID=1176127 RepID=A0A6A6BEW0_9PEZI|nr:uncharacterized protein K452DRAFT_248174 [Aplosporella prunicola CBS 121167]KAF2142709.1 hypothetical protein K452DRAFT_248174 [Aplosporella prunicola CBS 121167]
MDVFGDSKLDISKLTEKDKAELQQFIVAESQKARIQQSIHSLTDICFKKCIPSKISQGKLDRTEEPCMANCVDRFLDANHVVLRQLETLRNA